MITDLPAATGIDALAQAVESELDANVDAFAQANASLTAALAA